MQRHGSKYSVRSPPPSSDTRGQKVIINFFQNMIMLQAHILSLQTPST